MNRLFMIGNTHFDPVWLWTWDEGLSSIRSTFRAALDRMDEDPNFIYSFACPPLFDQIEQIDPALMAHIKERVCEGRWSLDEGLWVQPDCFSGTLEDNIRQALHGQLALLARFGRLSDTVFNIDSFGHPLMLAQVYAKARLPYAVVSRPDEQDLSLPDPVFRWRAPDGSELTVCRVNVTGAIYPQDTEKIIREALPKTDAVGHDLMLVYGVTNHGGAPTKAAIAAVNRMNAETDGRVVFSNTGRFFAGLDKNVLPVWKREIPIRSFGVFANRPDIKQEARRTGLALQNAERAAHLCMLLTGGPDRTRALAKDWQQLLFCQFHDILGGAALSDAESEALRQMGAGRHDAEQILHLSLQRIARDINLSNPDCPDAAWTLVVWNLNGTAYSGWVEAEVQWAWEFDWYRGPLCLTDENGQDIPCQLVLPRSVVPGFRQRFVFKTDIPAMGWRALRVRRRACASNAEENSTVHADEHGLSDGRLRVSVEDNGCLRIKDAETGRVLLAQCAVPVAVRDESDVWAFNFTGYGPEQPFRLESVCVTESGPLRARIKLRWTHGASFVEQRVSVYLDTGLVDGAFRVNWNERHETFKLRFKGSGALTAATPGYGVRRDFDGREVPCGGWFDLTDADGRGTLVLTDGFFGFDTPEPGVVRGTVLRSPIVGDLCIEPLTEADYEYMSQGLFEGRWRVLPHGAENEAFPWHMYDAFINAPLVTDEAAHPGALPLTADSLTVEGSENVLVTALKRAEDGSCEPVVRLQNFGGERESVCVSPAGYESFGALLDPYEILTMRRTEDGWIDTDLLEMTK